MSLQLLFRCAEIDSIIPKTVLWFNLGEREMLGLCNILGIHARQLRITTIDEWRALARTCHTVHYHDKNDRGTNWFELGATPYTISSNGVQYSRLLELENSKIKRLSVFVILRRGKES